MCASLDSLSAWIIRHLLTLSEAEVPVVQCLLIAPSFEPNLHKHSANEASFSLGASVIRKYG